MPSHVWIVVLVGCLGCSSAPADKSAAKAASTTADAASALFDPAKVLSVDITMPGERWDELRNKGRDMSQMATQCKGPAAKIYPFHEADVVVNGSRYAGAGVRKKGFLGSLSVLRPSLKIRTGDKSLPRLTLNNNKQDDALMRTCLVYQIFRDAKMPAPRCSFARVTVNGKDLGVYSNVEPIKKPFLRRHFTDDSGTLFEGQLADFNPPWLINFEHKANPDKLKPDQRKRAAADRLALVELGKALDVEGDAIVSAVSKYIDVEEFITFWALEALTGHWDGYAGNRNNFYLYRSPVDGKFHFIPWGPDLSLTDADPFHSPKRPASVSASADIAARLWTVSSVRAKYIARMRQLLDTVWNEKSLVAEVDRIDALLGGAPDDGGVDQIKKFINERAAKFRAELDAGGGKWDEKPNPDPCLIAGAEISGTFETTFGSIDAANPMVVGKATLNLTLGGKPITLAPLGVVAGRDKRSGSMPVVRFVGLSGSSIFGLQLFFEEPLFRDNETQPFHGFATWGMAFELEKMRDFKGWGFLGRGTITLDKAATTDGAVVKGTVRGTLFETPARTR